jgi:hypothetical protein
VLEELPEGQQLQVAFFGHNDLDGVAAVDDAQGLVVCHVAEKGVTFGASYFAHRNGAGKKRLLATRFGGRNRRLFGGSRLAFWSHKRPLPFRICLKIHFQILRLIGVFVQKLEQAICNHYH